MKRDLLIVLAFAIVIAFIYWRTSKPDIVVMPEQKEIQQKKLIVEHLATKTTNYKNILNDYKTLYDTTNIVLYQDSVIMVQDTQIVVLNQIVEKQDTVIDVLKAEVKAENRKRMFWQIATGVFAGGLATSLIIK